MFQKSLFACSCVLMATLCGAPAAEPPTDGEIKLSVQAEREQPLGFPVIIEVWLTNVGKDNIAWWCGGPASYPADQHFVVEIRLRADAPWRKASADNGQYVMGSGRYEYLAPGESIVVPLAVTVPKEDVNPSPDDIYAMDIQATVQVRVSPSEDRTTTWRTASPGTIGVHLCSDRRHADGRRARVITAVAHGDAPFWRHVAMEYPDPVVLDALLKLATVDCALIADRAAFVLARQPSLPEKAGDDFALLIPRWLTQLSAFKEVGRTGDFVVIALKTQNAAARQAVLDALQTSKDGKASRPLLDALALSPGDAKWLARARDAIITAQQAAPHNAELARTAKWATKQLDSRLREMNDCRQ